MFHVYGCAFCSISLLECLRALTKKGERTTKKEGGVRAERKKRKGKGPKENEEKGGKNRKKRKNVGGGAKEKKKEGGRWVQGVGGACVLRRVSPHTNNARSA